MGKRGFGRGSLTPGTSPRDLVRQLPVVDPDRVDWVVTFRPEPTVMDGPGAAQRMRKVLKSLGRAHGMRCVDIRAALPPVAPELDPTISEPPFVPPVTEGPSSAGCDAT